MPPRAFPSPIHRTISRWPFHPRTRSESAGLTCGFGGWRGKMALPMPTPEQKTYTFHVSGMHCNACILMTESELTDVPYVTKAKSSLTTHSVEVTGNFGDKTPEIIAEELTKVLQPHG